MARREVGRQGWMKLAGTAGRRMKVGRWWEEEEVEEEERGVSGQPGSSRATRRNPLSHPRCPSHPDDPANPLPTPCFVLLILFLLLVLSKPLPTSTFASFSTRRGWRCWSPIQPSSHAHTAKPCVPILRYPQPPATYRRLSLPLSFSAMCGQRRFISTWSLVCRSLLIPRPGETVVFRILLALHSGWLISSRFPAQLGHLSAIFLVLVAMKGMVTGVSREGRVDSGSGDLFVLNILIALEFRWLISLKRLLCVLSYF